MKQTKEDKIKQLEAKLIQERQLIIRKVDNALIDANRRIVELMKENHNLKLDNEGLVLKVDTCLFSMVNMQATIRRAYRNDQEDKLFLAT